MKGITKMFLKFLSENTQRAAGATLLLGLLMASPVESATPSKDDVRAWVQERLNPEDSLEELQIKLFHNESTGTGRVAVEGLVKLGERRVTAINMFDAERMLRQAAGISHISREALLRYLGSTKPTPNRGASIPNLLQVEADRGDILPFSGEFRYSEMVTGYDKRGAISKYVCCDTEQSLSEWVEEPIIIGSGEYLLLLGQLRYRHLYETEMLPVIAQNMLGRFLVGGTVNFQQAGQTIAKIDRVDALRADWSFNWGNGRNVDFEWTYSTGGTLRIESVVDRQIRIAGQNIPPYGSTDIQVGFTIGYRDPSDRLCIMVRSGGLCGSTRVLGEPIRGNRPITEEISREPLTLLGGADSLPGWDNPLWNGDTQFEMPTRFIDVDIAVQLLQGVWIAEDQSARIRIEGETVTHEFGSEDMGLKDGDMFRIVPRWFSNNLRASRDAPDGELRTLLLKPNLKEPVSLSLSIRGHQDRNFVLAPQ